MEETRYEKLTKEFNKALDLIEKGNMADANGIIYNLNVELYDLSLDLCDTQSDEIVLIDLSKLCKKVFSALEKDNKEIAQELLSDEDSEKLEDNKLMASNLLIESKRKEVADGITEQEDFDIWLTEFQRTDDNHFTDII